MVRSSKVSLKIAGCNLNSSTVESHRPSLTLDGRSLFRCIARSTVSNDLLHLSTPRQQSTQ